MFNISVCVLRVFFFSSLIFQIVVCTREFRKWFYCVFVLKSTVNYIRTLPDPTPGWFNKEIDN